MKAPPLLRNLSLAALPGMTPEEIAALPASVLAALHDEARAAADELKRRSDALLAGIERKYGALILAARQRQQKDFGVVRIADGEAQIECDAKKDVKWDQDQLARLAARMTAAGDDPRVYLKTEYKVSERAYADWPPDVRAAFEPARTVRPGKPAWKILVGGAK